LEWDPSRFTKQTYYWAHLTLECTLEPYTEYLLSFESLCVLIHIHAFDMTIDCTSWLKTSTCVLKWKPPVTLILWLSRASAYRVSLPDKHSNLDVHLKADPGIYTERHI